MLAPFVGILFGIIEPVNVKPEFSLNLKTLLNFLSYHITILKNDFGMLWALLFIAGLFIVFTLFATGLRYLSGIFLAPVRNGIVKNIRRDLYEKLLHLPMSEYYKQERGDVLSRITNDVSEVDYSVVKFLQSVVKDPIIIIVFAASLVMISPKLLLLIAVIFPIIWLIISRVGKSLKRNSDRLQVKYAEIMNTAEANIGAVKDVKSFTAEERSIKNFEKIHNGFTKFQTRLQRRIGLSTPLTEILVVFAAVLLILVGGASVINGDLPAANFMLFVVIFFRLLSPAKDFANAFFYLQKGRAALERIYVFLDNTETEKETSFTSNIAMDNEIAFQNVSFHYTSNPDHQVLKNIHFTIKKGQKVAITGTSGAGKTTLIDLLQKFYSPTSGKIEIDGTNLQNIDTQYFRSKIATVSQHTFLFNDSILNNLTMGLSQKTFTEQQIISASKIAYSYDFIMEMGGFNAQLHDRGNNLSGGQKQRLSITRAILRNPEILILDEATSALDNDTEKQVQDALDNLMKGRTCIIIAHRESTIKNADMVIKL
jgi:subfamily B ATP-binding cassette protein MsbA